MSGRAASGQRRRSFQRLMTVVARRDYLRTVRRRGFIFGTALLPLAMAGLVVISTVFAPSFQPAPSAGLTLVNESALAISLPGGASEVRLVDRASGEAALAGGELRELYVLPAGYPADPRVERLAPGGRLPGVEDFQRRAGQEQLLGSVLRYSLLVEMGTAPEAARRIIQPLVVRDIGGDGDPSDPGDAFGMAFLFGYSLTFLFVISIFITSGYLLQSVTEEKENRVVEILLSSVPPAPLMAGKIVGLGAAGLTQVAIWVAAGLAALPLIAERVPMLRGITVEPVVLAVGLVFFVLGYLAYGAIFAAVGALAPGTREAQQYSGFFGFFAVIPLIFTTAFVSDPGSPLVVALALFPLTAPAAMLQVVAVAPEPPWPLIGASLVSLGVFAVVATLAAARVFRATLLLYGSRPSVRRIVEAITARG